MEPRPITFSKRSAGGYWAAGCAVPHGIDTHWDSECHSGGALGYTEAEEVGYLGASGRVVHERLWSAVSGTTGELLTGVTDSGFEGLYLTRLAAGQALWRDEVRQWAKEKEAADAARQQAAAEAKKEAMDAADRAAKRVEGTLQVKGLDMDGGNAMTLRLSLADGRTVYVRVVDLKDAEPVLVAYVGSSATPAISYGIDSKTVIKGDYLVPSNGLQAKEVTA